MDFQNEIVEFLNEYAKSWEQVFRPISIPINDTEAFCSKAKIKEEIFPFC